jgi:hypothetical protein
VASKEKEEVESVASKEKEDPYDFDQDMAASEEPPQESSDKEESDREKEGDDETSKTKKVKETVENGSFSKCLKQKYNIYNVHVTSRILNLN